jgi:hypothetical protein
MSYRRSKGFHSTMILVLFTRACAASSSGRSSAGAPASPPLPWRGMSDGPVPAITFTAAERDYIRRELDMFFSTFPTVAEGFQLKSWRGGAQAGQPKLPPAAKSLLERGLMRLDATSRARLFFTERGLDALRVMMADRRLANPEKFAHVRQELGLDG